MIICSYSQSRRKNLVISLNKLDIQSTFLPRNSPKSQIRGFSSCQRANPREGSSLRPHPVMQSRIHSIWDPWGELADQVWSAWIGDRKQPDCDLVSGICTCYALKGYIVA